MADPRELPELFCRAVAIEALSGPKPGLVDPVSPSPHPDMGPREFCLCLPALRRCLREALELGLSRKPVEELVRRLPAWNVDVLTASAGPNPVRGVLFLGAVHCYSAGWERDPMPVDRIREVGRFCAERLWDRTETKCGRRRVREGLAGIFGEVASGLATARTVSLPTLVSVLRRGGSLEEAVVQSVLACMAVLEDAGLPPVDRRWVRLRARRVLRLGGVMTPKGRRELWSFVRECLERRVSPGASGDVTVVGLVMLFLRWGRDLASPYLDPPGRWRGGAVGADGAAPGARGRDEGGGRSGR